MSFVDSDILSSNYCTSNIKSNRKSVDCSRQKFVDSSRSKPVGYSEEVSIVHAD